MALIILLAQIGSFVPADSAIIGIVDRIFTRIGAQERTLAAGQSTFMVEMTEAANILNNATPRSFIILDEIGARPPTMAFPSPGRWPSCAITILSLGRKRFLPLIIMS